MNVYYAKTALYAYPNLEAVAEQIDEHVERSAVSSMDNYSPCIEQCQAIVDFTYQKDCLFALKLLIEDALIKLKKIERDLIGYKYFRERNNQDLSGINLKSRAYFRRQTIIIAKIAKILENLGATDKWFEETCMNVDFFKNLLRHTIEHEKSYEKPNKKEQSEKKEKNTEVSNIATSQNRLIA